MPAALATIPEIVIGNIVQGDVVLRNVVVAPKGYATDGGGGVYTQPIDMVTPWKPALPGGVRPETIQPANQFDSKLNPNDFAKLAPDTRVIFIDGNEIIDASRDEAPDFLNNGAYLIGAFAPETAQAVIRDMIENPIPSPETANADNVATIMKLMAAMGLSTMTFVNAYLDADEAWSEYEGLDDDRLLVLTEPPAQSIQVPQNFPAEREITISFAPDTPYANVPSQTPMRADDVLRRVLQRAPKAVRDVSKTTYFTPAGASVMTATYVVWIPDSVTDLQVLEGIRGEMNADQNVMIGTKRLTGVDVGIPAPIDPVPVLPEPNKAIVADKYAALLAAMQQLSNVCWTEFSNGTAISRPCEPGESPSLMPRSVQPRYESLERQAQVIQKQTGVPAGCSPTNPQVLPPAVVPAACLPPRPPSPKPPPMKLPPKPPTPPPGSGGGTGNPGGLFVDKATGKTYTREEVLAREGISLVTTPDQAKAMQSKLEGLPTAYTYLG